MRKIVLWGHQAHEFKEMFNLSEEEMNSDILEFGCGPSALNVEQAHKKHKIVSCDPLYVLDKDTLYSKVLMIFATMAEEVKKVQDIFDFSRSGGYEHLLAERQQGIDEFFSDYELGKTQGRYIGIQDYHLPFENFTFDFALSSYYLFADLDEQNVEFHLAVIKELARVAKEVRIFPLIDREGNTSKCLGPVLLGLQKDNYGVEVKEVAFHLYKTGNAMLRVWAQQCPV